LGWDVGDADVVWRVDEGKCSRALLQAMAARFLVTRAPLPATLDVFFAMLPKEEASRPMIAAETVIHTAGIDYSSFQAVVTLLAKPELGYVVKVDDAMYSLRVDKLLEDFRRTAAEGIVAERFGSLGRRIFNLLITKKHLDQKQVAAMAMVNAKATKEILYKLWEDGFVKMQEVPMQSDFKPKNSVFLWSVNLDDVRQKIIEMITQAVGNILLRLDEEQVKMESLTEGARGGVAERPPPAADDDAAMEDEGAEGKVDGDAAAAAAVATGKEKAITKQKKKVEVLRATLLRLDKTLLIFKETTFP